MTLFFRPPLVGNNLTVGSTLGVGVPAPTLPVVAHFSAGVGANGDAEVIIEADTDNSADNSNPRLVFVQDGGVREASVFLDDNVLNVANSISGGGFRIKTGTIGGFENAISRVFINPIGNVGIGTPPPSPSINRFEVEGDTKFDGDHEVTGDTTLGGSFAVKRIASGAGNLLSTGAIILAVTDTAAPRTVTIQSADILNAGQLFIVQDETNGAGANNITVATEGSETIDGAGSDLISTNRGNILMYSNGANLIILSRK